MCSVNNETIEYTFYFFIFLFFKYKTTKQICGIPLVINEPNMMNYIAKIYNHLCFCVLCVTCFLLFFLLFLT